MIDKVREVPLAKVLQLVMGEVLFRVAYWAWQTTTRDFRL